MISGLVKMLADAKRGGYAVIAPDFPEFNDGAGINRRSGT